MKGFTLNRLFDVDLNIMFTYFYFNFIVNGVDS